MDILTDQNNVNSETNFLIDHHQSYREQRHMPDFYPEPDSIHTHPQFREFNLSSNDEGEDKPVLRLQPSDKENDDSESTKPLNGAADGKLITSAAQTSTSSFESTTSRLSQNTVATFSCSTKQSNGDGSAAAEESADVVEDTMRKSLPFQTKKGHGRPGVILLGRGNSFSLGRSEVIFLHNTKPYRRSKGQTFIQQQGSGAVSNGRDNYSNQALRHMAAVDTNSPPAVLSSNLGTSTGTCGRKPSRPSPPPLSKQACVSSDSVSLSEASDINRPIVFSSGRSTEVDSSALVSGTCQPKSATGGETSKIFERSGDGDSDELAALWARAELIMAGKQRAVLDVLAQFGVGESGEDTKDGDEEEEEESVWQVVESKAHAVDR